MATNKLAVWMIFSPINFIGESNKQKLSYDVNISFDQF